jgi:hypothetical protein
MQRTSHLFAPRKLALLVAAALSGTAYADLSQQWVGVPITFERNDGQFPAEVLFASRGRQGVLAVRSGELAVNALRLRLAGANLAPEVAPIHPLVTRSHYYVGNKPANFVTNVPHYGELQVKDVYPGVDMLLHGRDGTLEYDFVVAPGADPKDIRLDLRGADDIVLDVDGNLLLGRDDARLTQHAPVAYQEDGGGRRAVPASFELVEGAEGPEALIKLGAYDPALPLTIDPAIAYSTYVGSSGTDGGTIVRLDPGGNLYFTQLGASGGVDPIVVSKLDPSTNTLVYQTSFGGHGSGTANDLAVGGPGQKTVYVAGTTRALDFPVLPPKSDASSDAFVAVLAPSGMLANTRLIGGSGSDSGNAIGLDSSGNVYVAGTTSSRDLPVTVGPTRLGGTVGASGSDGFVAKLDPSLGVLYLRFLGGSGEDDINSLAVDDLSQAIVAGTTFSRDFPQVSAGAPTSPPPAFAGQSRGFASKLTSDGTALIYSEFVGGSSFSAESVAFDPTTGDAIVGGVTARNDLVPAPSRPFGGSFDAYIVRIDPTGTPTFSTYLGGSGNDLLEAVGVDKFGNIFATGSTRSTNFPVVNGLAGQTPPAAGTSNAFVTRLGGSASSIDFSTYLGGSGNETGFSLDFGKNGSVWVGGFTSSTDFPTVNAFRATRSGPSDGFITNIDGFTPGRGRGRGPP